MESEKRLALIGVAMLAALLISFVLWRSGRQQTAVPSANSWDSRSLPATLAGIRVREIDAATARVVFFYDLDNKTDKDYRIEKGPGVVIMSRLKADHSLSSDQVVSLNSSVFAPAKNRTRIALEAIRPFNWPSPSDVSADVKFRTLVADQVSDVEGFVLFDQASRYQIELPGGWQAAQQGSGQTNHN